MVSVKITVEAANGTIEIEQVIPVRSVSAGNVRTAVANALEKTLAAMGEDE